MNIRDWLDKNKVFFEIISPICITIATIAILMVYIQTNKIVLYQARLMKAEQMPIIRFDTIPVITPSISSGTHRLTSEKLIISNIGSPLQEFSYKYIVFLEIGGTQESSKIRKTVRILLRDPDLTTGQSPNLEGHLVTFQVYLGKVWRKISGFINLARKKGSSISYCKMHEYMRLKYKDILGQNYDELYLIKTRSTGTGRRTSYPPCTKLSESTKEEIIKDYKRMRAQDLYLTYGALSPESLYEKWLAAIQEAKE